MCDSSNDSRLYYSRLQMISFSKNLCQRGDGGIFINKLRSAIKLTKYTYSFIAYPIIYDLSYLEKYITSFIKI